MRFRCPHCNEFGNVRNSEQQSPTVSYLYVACSNIECGHTWRVDAAASLTLSPSARPRSDVLIPLSPYVRRAGLGLQLEIAPTGQHQGRGPLQLDLMDDLASAAKPPS